MSSKALSVTFAEVHGTGLCRLFRNTEELEKLSELGVLFLLFEMGLELSLDRLKVFHCLRLQPH